MKKFKNEAIKIARDDNGVVTTETTIVIACVAIAAVTVLGIMNTQLPGLFNTVITNINNMVNGAMSGS